MSMFRIVTTSVMTASLAVASAAFAQTTPPPVTPPPAAPAQAAAPAAQPAPVPFPADAKFGFVRIEALIAGSQFGQEGGRRMSDHEAKAVADLQAKQQALNELQTKRASSVGVMNAEALAALDREITKAQLDYNYAEQTAQTEGAQLNADLLREFQEKVGPILEALATEKDLLAVFTIVERDESGQLGLAYIKPGLDLTAEVVRRLDALGQ